MFNSILAPIFVFAVIVLVHEGGHFIFAKLTGMKVEEFSVGFGPKIASTTKGDTMYSLRCIPLGGYNKITGMNHGESDDPRAFCERPVWARLVVIAAGSVFNVLLALFIFSGAYLHSGVTTFPNLPIVESVLEDSSAEKAGLTKGDKIISIDGHPVEKWSDIGPHVNDMAGRVLEVEIEHEGSRKTVTIIPQDSGEGRAIMGISSLRGTRRSVLRPRPRPWL